MEVGRPDGYVLRFGADHRPGVPRGDWLDGHRTAPDGADSRLQAEVGALANDMFAAAAGVGRSITSRLRSNVR